MTNATEAKDLCVRALLVMATVDEAAFRELIHPAATNREAVDEPAACRGTGPAAFLATARWLDAAFSNLFFEIHDAVAADDLVVLHATMSGRQTGTFVAFGPDARPVTAFPATGATFAITQTHWMRVANGQVVEHWANRDDRGMGQQLGWTPPSPLYLMRMLRATHRAKADVTPG